MTENAVLAPDGNMDYESAAALIGQDMRTETSNLAYLRINRDAVDDNENAIPIGTYTINTPDNGTIYSKHVRFRPFLNSYQYLHYDPAANKMANRSVIFADFREEIPDANGGFKCGKVPLKQQDDLSPEEKDYQTQIKCYRHLYGTVTFVNPVNVKGEKLEDYGPVPCLWRVRGSNFMPVGDAIASLSKQKKLMFNHELKLGTKREKRGGNTFYVATIEVDFTSHIPLAPEDIDLVKQFKDTISHENKRVMEEHRKAVKSKVSDDDVDPEKLLNDDLNDELPPWAAG